MTCLVLEVYFVRSQILKTHIENINCMVVFVSLPLVITYKSSAHRTIVTADVMYKIRKEETVAFVKLVKGPLQLTS